jgi:long-subunit acyl-CoA synthetase (AMP-forming)
VGSTEDGSYEIFDEDSVQLGSDGEILVRGDSVTNGYYHDKDATDAAIYGGFFHTGDYGRMNSKGRLVITKRNSGIILLPTGAKICKKVTSNEITALNGVAEARVLLYDSKLVAVVVPMQKDAKPDRLRKRIDRFNEEKGYRWSIQRVVFLDKPLPKTEEGSVDEKELELIVAHEDENE